MDLKKYDDAAQARDNAPVREYASILAEKGYPQRLLDAVPQAEKLLTSNQKIAARIAKEYPLAGNQNRPPWLRDQIAGMHQNYLRPLLDHYVTLPARLRQWAEKIKSAKPGDFKFYYPQVIAKYDIEKCASLTSEVQWLEAFAKRVEAIEALIAEWIHNNGGRTAHPNRCQHCRRGRAWATPRRGRQFRTSMSGGDGTEALSNGIRQWPRVTKEKEFLNGY